MRCIEFDFIQKNINILSVQMKSFKLKKEEESFEFLYGELYIN